MNKRVRTVELRITRRWVPQLAFFDDISEDMPRNNIFDYLKAKYQYLLSDEDIISISAVLTEPDGSQFENDGDHDWIQIAWVDGCLFK